MKHTYTYGGWPALRHPTVIYLFGNKAVGKRMTQVCVSRAKGKKLVLDL